MSWTKSSWRNFPVKQQPNWYNKQLVLDVTSKITNLPALIFAGECRQLSAELSEIEDGEAFLLQAGECSEDFSHCNGPYIHSYLKVILQMSMILAHSSGKKIVSIGRIAGQYSKPRSSDWEEIDGIHLPSFKGDMVNGIEFSENSRKHDPSRMLEGYFRSTATLNLLRAFTRGGFASLNMMQTWLDDYYNLLEIFPEYKAIINDISRTLNFMKSQGIDLHSNYLNDFVLYTSHEALLLEYEECLTRIDTITGDYYDLSAHMLWIGDRTRQIDGAHVEFLSGVRNPIGIKIGPSFNVSDFKFLCEKLNPRNEKGRLSFIGRFGANKISEHLPKLVREVIKEGINASWICDPMHGNTYTADNQLKTRDFNQIVSEIKQFWEINKSEGTNPGGIHLELTGEHVTECIGGINNVTIDKLTRNYKTNCDPRLNALQAVEISLELANIIKS